MKSINALSFELNDVLDYSRNSNIRAIYDFFRREGYSIEESECLFLEAVRLFIELHIARLDFRAWVREKDKLNNSSVDIQLNFIRNTFPDYYDENIPEKDIDNLWWYAGCPVDIEWKQEDGHYYVTG